MFDSDRRSIESAVYLYFGQPGGWSATPARVAEVAADIPFPTVAFGNYVNAADDGDGQLGESAEELSSCQTLQTIKCNGGQPGSLTAFKKVCNDYCWYRGWPSCSHTWTKCPAVADGIIPIVKQYGYGGQCRCRVSWSGVQ